MQHYRYRKLPTRGRSSAAPVPKRLLSPLLHSSDVGATTAEPARSPDRPCWCLLGSRSGLRKRHPASARDSKEMPTPQSTPARIDQEFGRLIDAAMRLPRHVLGDRCIACVLIEDHLRILDHSRLGEKPRRLPRTLRSCHGLESGRANASFQPPRLMITSAADGCKTLLDLGLVVRKQVHRCSTMQPHSHLSPGTAALGGSGGGGVTPSVLHRLFVTVTERLDQLRLRVQDQGSLDDENVAHPFADGITQPCRRPISRGLGTRVCVYVNSKERTTIASTDISSLRQVVIIVP
jgi:hypothetical protein